MTRGLVHLHTVPLITWSVHSQVFAMLFDMVQTFVYNNNLYFQRNPFTTPVQVTNNNGNKYVYNGISDWLYEGICSPHYFSLILQSIDRQDVAAVAQRFRLQNLKTKSAISQMRR